MQIDLKELISKQ